MSGTTIAYQILDQLGFVAVRKERIYKEIDICVEIPDNHLAGDPNRITRIQFKNRPVNVIGLEDLLLDRLRAAVHWKSASDREWGYRFLLMYRDELDVNYLKSSASTQLKRQTEPKRTALPMHTFRAHIALVQ